MKSINKVLLKYKQITFLFFSVFILHLYFLGSSLKAYFYWTSRVQSINEVYLKYTSNVVCSVRDRVEHQQPPVFSKNWFKNWCASSTSLWYSSMLSGPLIFITPIMIVSKPLHATSSSWLEGFHL